MPLPLSVLTLGADRFKAASEIKGVTNDAKLRKTASEFEAIFVQHMLKTMRESSIESDLLPTSVGEKMFRSLLDEQYAKLSAKSGNLGLGEMIYQQLKTNLDK